MPAGADDGSARRPTGDALAGLPPAHVVVAEIDPLHDGAFARRADRRRHAHDARRGARLVHGFLRAAPYAAARAAQSSPARRRAALHG